MSTAPIENERDETLNLPKQSFLYKFNLVKNFILFIGLHFVCLTAIWLDFGVKELALCAILYVVRMFGVTGGYHRYFAHRTYKTSRVMQFLLAFLAMTSAQKGVLWWASHHRHHHRYSDSEHDVHSPGQRGFWWSHMGWILSPEWEATDGKRVRDLAKYPELVWLNNHPVLPSVLGGIPILYFFGVEGLVVGYLWSTIMVWHATFTVNSLAHVIGTQRYQTGDDSRNHWLLALITLGEGWHNNHHHYQASARNGFFWWEVDITYYILWAMSKVGLVWDLRQPPERILRDEQHPDVLKASKAQAARKAVEGHMRDLNEDAP